MEKIELQEVIDACTSAQSDYIKLFRPLLGYEDKVALYRGIDDSLQATLEEVESIVGMESPGDFLQLYLISNGGKYFDLNLYYLTNDKDDTNGLYYVNTNNSLKEEYNIASNMFILGETGENEFILCGIDENGYYYYCTWDKEEKQMNFKYDFLIEIVAGEIDYYTEAFSA